MKSSLAALLLLAGLLLASLPAAGLGDAPNQLMAGAAEGLMRVPVGTPLGGYLRPPVGGEFFGSQTPDHVTDAYLGDGADGTPLVAPPDEARVGHSPYAHASPPSRGYHDALTIKAVALDDGSDIAVLVKVDAIGMLDEWVVAVADEVLARTGIDVADGLVMTATHTHDGPGAVANHSARYFFAAMDVYQPEVFAGLVSDAADVVVQALENRVPARFGYVMGAESRPDSLNSWRRSRSPWSAERVAQQEVFRRRLGVLRVDEVDPATGEMVRPLAVVMNYAAHGIMFDVENVHFSGDGLGGAERYVESSYDQPVVAMYVQSAAGDVSPRADNNGRGRPTLQRIERFGELLGRQVRALADGIDNFDTHPEIEVASQRVILNRETLGYAEGEFPHEFGAAQCNNAELAPVGDAATDRNCIPAPPPDAWDLADNGVAENAAFLPGDTRVTVARVGGALLIGQPGEPLTEQGLRLVEAAPTAPEDTFVFGYTTDHVGYVLPDSREDWLLGGVEGTTTFWGWKQGARLLRSADELMDEVMGLGEAPADEFEASYIDLPFVPAPSTPSAQPGRVMLEPVDIDRFEQTTFMFEGGDPVADLPSVTMQRLDADGVSWSDVRGRGGRTLNTPYEYEIGYEVVSGSHAWTVTFESPKDWPAGTYRFVVSGNDYETASAAFTVAPAGALVVENLTRNGPVVRAEVGYTPRPTNKRLIDAETRSEDVAPMRLGTVTFTGADGIQAVATTPRIEWREDRPVAIYEAALPGDGLPSVAAVDAWGNGAPQAGILAGSD